MPIDFPCPHCQAQIRVAEGAAGKTGTCPQCRKKLIVPAASPSPEPTAPAIQFKSADPEPVAAVVPAETGLPVEFPEFEEPRKTTSSVRDRRQKKPRSSSSLAVPLICGGVLIGAILYYFFRSNTGLTGTLDGVVLTKPELPAGSITRSGLSVNPEAFDRVRAALEEQTLSLFDRHRLTEVELSASRTGFAISIQPTKAARTVSVTLTDPQLRKYVADHAEEFNAVRTRQIATYAADFVNSWDGKTDDERAKLPHLNNYFQDMALASASSGFGYHVALWDGKTSYPCVAVGRTGALYFCVPKEPDRFILKGHQPTSDSLLFPGEYTVQIRAGTPAPNPNSNPNEPESKPAAPESDMKPGEPGSEMSDDKPMKPSGEN